MSKMKEFKENIEYLLISKYKDNVLEDNEYVFNTEDLLKFAMDVAIVFNEIQEES